MEEEVAKNLAGVWYLATSVDGQPHVRPFDQATVVNGTVYVGTAKNKAVYEQILANPKVEIYAQTNFGPYRLMAEAIVEEDEARCEEAFMKMGKIFQPGVSAGVKLVGIRKYENA